MSIFEYVPLRLPDYIVFGNATYSICQKCELFLSISVNAANNMSKKLIWSPNTIHYDIEEMLENIGKHSGRGKQMSPSEYLKLVEGADKALGSLAAKNAMVRGDADIRTMLAQAGGTLSADKNDLDLATASCPSVSTQSAGKVIDDRIPIILDDESFKVPNK